MANPAADYPEQLHDPTDISAKASAALGSTPKKHSEVHGKIEQEILEVQKKLGIGESNASDATEDQVLTINADGSTEWRDPAGAGGGTPGGSDTQVQFNDSGAFAGDSGLTYNKTTDSLKVGGGTGNGSTLEVNGTTDTLYLSMQGVQTIDNNRNATLNSINVDGVAEIDSSGNISGANLSGTNTGDQTLSGLGGALDTSGLYTPRRRPRPPHIVKMIQSFDQTGHSWFSGGATVSSNPADTDSEVGVHASIFTGTTGTSTYSKYNFGTFNATDRNLVALVRVEDMTAISGIVLRIGSGTNVTSNYYDLQVSAGNVSSSILNTGEWVPVTFSWAKSVAVGSPDRSALKSLQFRVPAFNSKSTTVRFKSIGISEQRGPYCLISFDDNQVSANLALPYMNKYGFSGTMYSIAERIDTPDYQTMEDVLSMQNDFNWEIACHSYTAAAHDSPNGMEDLTLPQLDTELRNLKKWALENNISGSDHFVWPKGRFRPDMIPVAERYFVSAGMVSHYINQTLPTFTPMRMARRGVTSTTTLANIQTEIDTAIANDTSIEFIFHKIVSSGATGETEYNASDFGAAIDYIASSGIEVRTISEVVYGYCDADGTKLDSIEFGADVTDATNVTAAGAVMTTGAQNVGGAKTFTEDVVVTESSTNVSNYSLSLENSSATATSPAGVNFRNSAGLINTARITANPGSAYADSSLKVEVADSSKALQTRMLIDVAGRITIGATLPTHALTFPSTATGIALYNTSDQTTNYERLLLSWSSNQGVLRTQLGGTGTGRDLIVGTQSTDLLVRYAQSASGSYEFIRNLSIAGAILARMAGSMTQSSGTTTVLSLSPTINQTDTAGYTTLLINPTETAIGSGSKLLIDARVGGTSKFSVDNTGAVTISDATANTITGFDSSKKLMSLNVATYPSLTELACLKGVTSAIQTQFTGKISTTQKGAANGVAELDAGGLVPSSQLPSYVDDVLEYANFAALPVFGETGKIYITIDDNKTYRWSGSLYVEISASLALGETSSTAYRGDRGKIAYDHSQDVTTNPHAVTKTQVGLSNVTNDAQIPLSYLDTDGVLAANSDVKVASQKAVNTKIYAKTAVIKPTSGDWYSMGGQSAASAPGLTSAGQIRFHPLWLDIGTITEIAVSTTVAAVSTWRLGLYEADPATGLPDGMVPFWDAGTVNMNNTAGLQSIVASKVVTKAGLYWGAVLVDAYTAQPTTHNVVYSSNSGVGILGLPQDMSSFGRYRVGRSYGSTVATGSLPTAPTSSMSWNGLTPRIAVKY